MFYFFVFLYELWVVFIMHFRRFLRVIGERFLIGVSGLILEQKRMSLRR